MRRRTFPLPFSLGNYGSVELRLRSSPASLQALEDFISRAQQFASRWIMSGTTSRNELFEQSTKKKTKKKPVLCCTGTILADQGGSVS